MAADHSVERTLLIVLVQLITIMAAARAAGALFRWIGQPQVVGEIAAGLLLGPSFLGRIAPALSARIFAPETDAILAALSQLGLVFLMFLIGLHCDFTHIPQNRKATISVAVAGIVVPFLLGIVVAPFLQEAVGSEGNHISFALFVATALSITAIPVLGRILMEFNLTRTRIGAITIAAAAFNDATGWILLSFLASVTKAQAAWFHMVALIAATAAFAVLIMTAGRWLLLKWLSTVRAEDGQVSQEVLAILLIALFGCAIAAKLIGLSAIFGAFLLGAALHDQPVVRKSVLRQLQGVVVAFFLPIFFTHTGLRTDMGTMTSPHLWFWCGIVTLVAILGKVGGAALAARMNGLPWRESSSIGLLMNTRGLMELVVINLGFEMGVIPRSVFFMLVMMALVTTCIACPLVRWLIPGSELEPAFAESDIARRGLFAIR